MLSVKNFPETSGKMQQKECFESNNPNYLGTAEKFEKYLWFQQELLASFHRKILSFKLATKPVNMFCR